MSEEEKKAIEAGKEIAEKFKRLYLKGFNNEKITDKDRLSYLECALLSDFIEKLQKENEELKFEERSRIIGKYGEVEIHDVINRTLSNDYISVKKIKVKIEELDIAILECEYSDDDSEEYKKEVEKDKLELLKQKRILKELLEGDK